MSNTIMRFTSDELVSKIDNPDLSRRREDFYNRVLESSRDQLGDRNGYSYRIIELEDYSRHIIHVPDMVWHCYEKNITTKPNIVSYEVTSRCQDSILMCERFRRVYYDLSLFNTPHIALNFDEDTWGESLAKLLHSNLIVSEDMSSSLERPLCPPFSYPDIRLEVRLSLMDTSYIDLKQLGVCVVVMPDRGDLVIDEKQLECTIESIITKRIKDNEYENLDKRYMHKFVTEIPDTEKK